MTFAARPTRAARRAWGTTLRALSLLACASLRPPDAQATSSYERWRVPVAIPAQERSLLHVVRTTGHAHSLHLAYDWRLQDAAEALLGWARTHTGEPLPLQALRQAAWHAGWTDGELAAIALTSPVETLVSDLREQLHALFREGADLNQVGIVSQRAPPEIQDTQDPADPSAKRTVVIAFSRRLMRLAPIPEQVLASTEVALSGRLLQAHPHGVRTVLAYPDGTTLQVPAQVNDGHVSVQVPTGTETGPLQVQLLVERGRGPEVAVDFPLWVQGSHAAVSDADAPDEGHHGSLLALLYGLRHAHGLPMPVPTPKLMQAARNHAADMARNHFFAHISPRTGDVTKRLRTLHQPITHVVENIAEGSNPSEIFSQWLHSPSHRLNLLDPKVTAVGLATVSTGSGTDATTIAVLVMAALEDVSSR